MQVVVNDFNGSQDRIYVEFQSVSDIPQKTLAATAGGVPPDIAGGWAVNIVEFADKNALTPLDDLARGTNVTRDRYLPVYWDMGVYQGTLYGIPSTPATTALYWNKGLFRAGRPGSGAAAAHDRRARRVRAEADPRREERPAHAGRLPAIGAAVVAVLLGQLLRRAALGRRRAHDRRRAQQPARVRVDPELPQALLACSAIQNLSASFGNFASPQDPFMSGKLAMIFQGVWWSNYIHQYAPKMDFGAAPFPVLHEGDPPTTYVDTDVLMIPRAAKHAREAFEFFKFLAQQAETEKLNFGQQKNSPLREVSDGFIRNHPHPYIRLFQDLASSPRAIGQPRMSTWWEYRGDFETAFQRVWLMQATPAEALHVVQARAQKQWDRAQAACAAQADAGLAARRRSG